ncbi:MAG: VWA domain-containing protein [Aestuariivirga sp.]
MAKPTTAVTSESEGDVSAFLEKVRGLPPVAKSSGGGKLVFSMDATMSRQPSWDRALSIQAEMFAETARIGGLDIQLVYFRGFDECRASKWISNPKALARLMTKVDCRGGNTQIGRVLSHVKNELRKTKINAVVYVGDAMEESIDMLCQSAGEIGLQGTPIFTFQEGNDGSAERCFREMARLSKGAYFKLDESSANTLRELLSAVAVYAAGGRAALESLVKSRGGNSSLLLQQLK